MSGYQPATSPRPPNFGDADYRDSDAYGLDCRQNMALRGDYITGASLVEIQRVDGAALTDGDLTVSAVGVVQAGVTIVLPGGPVVTTSGMFVSWTAAGGVAGSGYRVTLALTLASGAGPINRTVIINVPSYVG